VRSACDQNPIVHEKKRLPQDDGGNKVG
jgi:hypothetical protein